MMTCEDAERILCNQCIHHVHCMIHDKECEPMNRLKQPQWIPASERLPEEGAVVLVSLEKDEDWFWVRRVREGYYEEGYWFHMNGAHYGLEVLAWLPLPEPYKEGE